MLNYTSLFSDLEELFRNAGRDPASFRRLMREVQRVREDLDEYYLEVAADYLGRLEERLARTEAPRLSPEEVTLLRAVLGLPSHDPERDARLVEDIGSLEQKLERVLALRGRPLSLKNLDELRRHLESMQSLLPGIVHALSERERARRFEEAVGDGEALDREWLLAAIRRILAGEGAGSPSSDELRLGG
ncbi:MAG: hypothetical protein D6731_19785 [Planctomycetota bacterium]|nr:MAG: hypothetical protein D6731_19785 [Planctomycetota bacterium]